MPDLLYNFYKKFNEARGVDAHLTRHAFKKVGPLRAFEGVALKPTGVVKAVRKRQRQHRLKGVI